KRGLYLALYVRDGVLPSNSLRDDRYHWALLSMPIATDRRPDKASRFHARNFFSSPDQTNWVFEEIYVDASGTPKLLSKTYIGDILDNERFLETLMDVPMIQDAPEWSCVEWIKKALDDITREGEAV
ncbi:hypothetical protein EJ08DRAFT_559160, partial [Tothia fuscella]